MESLRKQLAETQEALNTRSTQLRELKHEKIGFDVKLQRLEAEIRQLRQGNGATTGSSARPSHAQEDGSKNGGGSSALVLMDKSVGATVVAQGDDDETIVITRSRMREAETKYKKVTEELAEKTKLCESLQRRFPTPGCSVKVPEFNVTDDMLIIRWESLRKLVRTLTLDRFNQTIQPKLVSEKAKLEFEALTKHWKSYMSNDKLTCYIFRALIWRYLHTCLLRKYWHVWGKQHGDAAVHLASLFSTKASEAEYQAWRMHTTRLIHQTCKPDPGHAAEVTKKILEATTQFATGTDTEDLKKKLSEIVNATVEISTMFGRSHYLTLMTDKPGSQLNYGFPYKLELMEIKGRFGSHTIVDLMVTPCLLKKDGDYAVLVKAEVIC
ncbi:hypothetical protein F4781DRAFT_379112 [Annulohypoxylon bovei var. microspora]|nr:hypothetical protein F4781DRAFT_379112 [Annulohypoxylon bovei var. microspora]